MLDFIRQFRGMIFKKKDNSATPLVYSSTQEGAIYNNNNAEMRTQIGGADRAVVTDSQSQTLTNKTLTSPVINSPTGIVKGDVGLGDVDNTSDATKNAAIAALTNKTINADLNTITNITTSNLKSGVLNVSTVLSGATDAQIPSAQAVKTYVDNAVASKDQASEISYSNSTSGLAATNVQDAIDEVDGNVDNLVTLSGVALDAVNLGTFTGTTIPDNQTNKQAFQALETAHESHTGASSGVHGVIGSVVGTSDSQTLSNKTIVASNNTITTAASGNLAATELNAALAELQGDIDSRATSTELSNHINNVSGAHAASAISNTPSGNLAATTVQAALNELQSDIDTRALSVGGSIQSPVRLDVKKDTKANLLTYAATASNGQLCFATDTKEMFQVLDGALVSVGSGGTSNVDALLTQTFDESALTDFTQTGLALIETNPMNGKKTARLIHQAATTQSFKYVKAVDPKYRGKNLTMSFQVRSSATAGNVTLNIYDETNVANIISSQSITLGSVTVSATTNSNTTLSGISSSDINKLKVGQTITGSGIATGTTISAVSVSALTATLSQAATASATVTLKVSDLPQKQSASFDVPVNCASLSYTISALAESGLPETYVDDVVIQLTSAALTSTSVTVPVNNNTEPTLFNPTFTALGTPTNVNVFWHRDGSHMVVQGRFTSATGSASEARIDLPLGLTTSSILAAAQLSNVNLVGHAGRSSGLSGEISVIAKQSVNYINFAISNGSQSALLPANGDALWSSGAQVSFYARIPIQGWLENETTSKTIPLTSAVFATQPDSHLQINGFAGATSSTNTSIFYLTSIAYSSLRGTAIQYSQSSTLGDTFTALVDGIYSFHFCCDLTTAGTMVGLTKNASQLSTDYQTLTNSSERLMQSDTGDTATFSWEGYLSTGDKLRLHRIDTSSFNVGSRSSISMAYRGAVKQLNPSSDQKIDLPSSELRMGLYNGCGSTNTRVAKFTSVEKLVGDAFTIVNDPALGFSLTMKKSGFIDLSFFSGTGAAYKTISRNATQLSTDPTSMTAGQNLSNDYYEGTVSWSGKCNIGDVFRAHVASAAAALGTASNLGSSFNALFQEDKVQVSLSNVLPQFTQSDNALRVNTGTSFGTTNTSVRRFTSIIDNIGTSVTYADSPSLGASFTINEDGLYSISYTEQATASNFGIGKNMTAYAQTQDMIAWATANGSIGIDFATASCQVYLVKGDVIRPLAGSPGNHNNTVNVKFHISKVGKPNLTSVDVTPFTNYKGQDYQTLRLDTANSQGSVNTAIKRFLNVRDNSNNGIFRYEDSPSNGASITILKKCYVTMSWIHSADAGVIYGISVNSNQLTTPFDSITQSNKLTGASQSTGIEASATFSGYLNAGDIVRPHGTAASNNVSRTQREFFNMMAIAEADQIVSPISSFSSDTASLVYAPSTSYTLSTLANAPVGTFITFTYDTANNVTSRPQTTTAPTQTVSDMNVNGIRLFIRDYNSTSTAASPCAIAIQVGKGFKGHTVDIYKSTGKVTGGSYDMFYDTAAVYGAFRSYDETSGILYLDAGRRSANGGVFVFNDNTTQTNGYVVINASKSPSLAAVPQLQPRIAVLRDEKASGTQGGTFTSGAWQTRTLNTIEDSSGIVTSLVSNQFILPAGEYFIEAIAPADAVENHKCKIRNITDSTDAIIGTSGDTTAGTGFITHSFCSGRLILNTAKTFELQHRCNSTLATSGFGEASSYGVNEVYSVVKIQKIK